MGIQHFAMQGSQMSEDWQSSILWEETTTELHRRFDQPQEWMTIDSHSPNKPTT